MAHAQTLAAGALAVDVNEQNEAALRFYVALGFAVVGRSPTDSGGRPFPLLHMRRPAPKPVDERQYRRSDLGTETLSIAEGPMVALRVRLNGEEAITAGLPDQHGVTVVVGSSARDRRHQPPGESARDLRLHVGGLRTLPDGSRNSLVWLDSKLTVGDTVTVDVVEVSEVAVPAPRETKSADVVERGDREQLRYLLEKYGAP